jgi:hypothetical protein
LTRADSKSKFPDGVKAVAVDYNDENSIVSALQGQQFLVITLSVFAPHDTHSKLVQAAAKAGVSYMMPNCYGQDFSDEVFARENLTGELVRARCAEIEAAGASWIALVNEYSLVAPSAFGFDFQEKKITFYDDGKTKLNVSTWEQCGRAVAALLSLKEHPEDEKNQEISVSSWKNKPLRISSFLISQQDMLESWNRVSGDKDEDWKIEHESSTDRYNRGLAMMKRGEMMGFQTALYARSLYPNGDGNFESKFELANEVLGLPKEDLDESTKKAKQMIEEGYDYLNR